MSSLPLFPLPETSKLVGIARLASEGESLREGHNVENWGQEAVKKSFIWEKTSLCFENFCN
jgi:hypothetical protein